MNVESDATFRPRLRGSYRSAKGFAAAFRSRGRIDNQPFAERVLRLLANEKHFCAPVFIAVPKRMSRFPRLHATAESVRCGRWPMPTHPCHRLWSNEALADRDNLG